MVDINDSEAFARANQYSGSGSWLDEANSHDAALPGGSNDPTFYSHDGTNYARLPGVASNTLTAPDATVWDIVDNGDIDIRIRVAMADYTPAAIQYFISKNPAGGATGWGAYCNTDGTLVFEMGDGSNRTATSSAANGQTDGAIKWFGFTYDSSAGTANFYTNDTNVANITTWTQLGNADIAISAGTVATNNTDDVEIGSSAGAERLIGRIYDVEVRDGINGTEIGGPNAADVDETDIVAGTHTDGQSLVWTMAQSGTAELIRWINRAEWWYDTDDYHSIPDDAALDYSNSDDFTIGVGGRVYNWDRASQEMLAKWSGAAGGYRLHLRSGIQPRFQVDDGTNDAHDTIGTPTDGTATTLIGVRNTSDDDVELFKDGTGSGSPTNDDTTLTLATANTLRLGADTGGNYLQGSIWSYSVISSALTDGEVGTGADTLHDNLLNQTVPAAPGGSSDLGGPEGWGFVRMGA